MLTFFFFCYVFVLLGIVAGAVALVVRRERELQEGVRALWEEAGLDAPREDESEIAFDADQNEVADGPVFLSTRAA